MVQTATPPIRSWEQQMEALEKANDVRTARARLKRNLKGRRITIHQVLNNPPEYVESMKLFDLMMAAPKYGRVKVNKILATCRISPSKTIGGLSDRQRDEITTMMRAA